MGRPLKYNHGYISTTTMLGEFAAFDPTWWYKSKRKELIANKVNLNKVDPIDVCMAHKHEQQRVGRGVHKAVEDYLTKGKYKVSYEQHAMAAKIVDWCKQIKLKPFKIEEPLYWNCEVHHPKPHETTCEQDCPDDCTCFTLGGTPDVIGSFKGSDNLWVIDWKTDRVPPGTADERATAIKYYWQNVCYSYMAQKQYGVTITGGMTVRSTTLEKVKPKTQIKSKLQLPEYVQVEYSSDYTFATYTFSNLTQGFKDIKMLRHIYRQVKGK